MSLCGGEEREARGRGEREKEGEWGGVGGEKDETKYARIIHVIQSCTQVRIYTAEYNAHNYRTSSSLGLGLPILAEHLEALCCDVCQLSDHKQPHTRTHTEEQKRDHSRLFNTGMTSPPQKQLHLYIRTHTCTTQ